MSLNFPEFPRSGELLDKPGPVSVSDDGKIVLMPTAYWLEIVAYALRLYDVEDVYKTWAKMQEDAFLKNGWK